MSRVIEHMGVDALSRGAAYWLLQVPGWLLLAYLVYAQAIPAFDYELGVRMGTQEPAQQITDVGAAFWYGFAVSDLVIYIPLLAAGLIAHWRGLQWWRPVFGAALGITVYWPVVALVAAVDARDAPGWSIDETAYWIVLPIIAVWAVVGLLIVARGPESKVAESDATRDRQRLVEELVSVRHQSLLLGKRLRSEHATRFVEQIDRAQRELMVELYLTHFTNEQLHALLGFYRSEIGRAVVETDRLINQDYQEELPARMKVLGEKWQAESGSESDPGTQRVLRAYPSSDSED